MRGYGSDKLDVADSTTVTLMADFPLIRCYTGLRFAMLYICSVSPMCHRTLSWLPTAANSCILGLNETLLSALLGLP